MEIKTASRTEWLEARRRLLVKEKALTYQKDALAIERRALPSVEIEEEYIFETEGNSVSLQGLFGVYSQLIVYHFMFGADWDQGCKSCSFWADNFNGLIPHLNARDTAFTAISKAPMSVIAPFKKRMGWGFNWVSSTSNNFNADFNVGFGDAYPNKASMMFNFERVDQVPMDEMFGVSVFSKHEGKVFHTYSTYGRGLEAVNSAYGYIDMTPKGRDEQTNGNPMEWVRHHDLY